MTDLQIVKTMTGETDEALLNVLLQEAEERLLNETGREVLPDGLATTKRAWAIVAYNRLSMEGESSRSEAGISSAFVEIPADIMRAIHRYRLARVGGRYHDSYASGGGCL